MEGDCCGYMLLLPWVPLMMAAPAPPGQEVHGSRRSRLQLAREVCTPFRAAGDASAVHLLQGRPGSVEVEAVSAPAVTRWEQAEV